jgi:hypothetical protein
VVSRDARCLDQEYCQGSDADAFKGRHALISGSAPGLGQKQVRNYFNRSSLY